jgi:uncharacterized protein with GYD domain
VTTYIIFFSFTQQGIQKIKESPSRVNVARQIIKKMGGKVKDFYAPMGMAGYDTIFIVEAPDDETVARAVLEISSKGNVLTNTVRAFTEKEYQK